MDLSSPLSDIDEAHGYVLFDVFNNYKYDYARGMFSIYLFPPMNLERKAYTGAVQKNYGKNLPKTDYYTVMLDRWPPSHSKEMLKHKYSMRYAADQLHIHYGFGIAGNDISPAQSIKLREILNFSIRIARRKAELTGTAQNLLS